MEPTNFYTLPDGKTFYKKFDVDQCLENEKKWHTRPRKDYPHGDSPTMYACRTSQKEATLFLLSKMDKYRFGAPKVNDDKQSIIHIACDNGDPDIIKEVVERCAMSENALHAVDKDGMTPLAILVKNVNKVGITVFQFFRRDLIVPPNLNNTKDPLVMASKLQDPTILQMLLAKKATSYDKYTSFQSILSRKETTDFATCFQDSASLENKCLAAIRLNQPHLLRLILINAKWTIPTSILKMIDKNPEMAAVFKNLQKYNLTQVNNSQVSTSNNFMMESQSQSAQHVATNTQPTNVQKQNPNYDEKYEQLFVYARFNPISFSKQMEEIKKNGNFNLYAVNKDGHTLLHVAIKNKAIRVAVKLVLEGFDIEARDIFGKTAIKYASETGQSREENFLFKILKYSKTSFSTEELSLNLENQLSSKEQYSEDLAFYLFHRGAIPSQRCYELAVTRGYFELANEMLSSEVIPTPGSFPNVQLEIYFAESWLRHMKDPTVQFKEALRIGRGQSHAFNCLYASHASLSQKFVAACQVNAFREFKELLQQDIFLNDDEKLIAWKSACTNPSDMAQMMIEKGLMDLNFLDENRNTGFHLAAKSNNHRVLRYFCSVDQSGIERRNGENLTPLQIANSMGNNGIACLSVLLKFDAQIPDLGLLHHWWSIGDPNFKEQVFARAPKEVMLFAFRRFGFLDLKKIISEYSFSIELVPSELQEMLDITLKKDSLDALSILTSRFFNLQTFTFTNNGNFLHAAAYHNATNLFSNVLESRTLNEYQVDSNGLIPFDLLIEKNVIFAEKYLPMLSMTGKIRNENTCEKLWKHFCAIRKVSIAIQYLSSSPTVLNKAGLSSPLHISSRAGDLEGLKLLLALKAWDINQRNASGENAFHCFVQSEPFLNGEVNPYEVIQLFLTSNADLSITNIEGETAFRLFFNMFWKKYINHFENNWKSRNQMSTASSNSPKKEACRNMWQSLEEEKFKNFVYLFRKLGFDGKDVIKYMKETKWTEKIEMYSTGGFRSVTNQGFYSTTETVYRIPAVQLADQISTCSIKELIPNSYELLKKN